MLRIRPLALMAALVVLPAFIQCSSSDKGSAGPTGTVAAGEYKGLLTSTSATGVLDIVLAGSTATASLGTQGASAGLTATGTITMVGGGGAITLSGTFDSATGKLTLTGTGYSLDGTATGSSLTGTYSGPSGAGQFSILPVGSGAVTLYCGTYSGDANGVWNLVVDGAGTALGNHCDSKACGELSGTASATNVTLNDPLDPQTTATGSLSGISMTGTWGGASSAKGTWQGSQNACGAGGTAALPVGKDGGK